MTVLDMSHHQNDVGRVDYGEATKHLTGVYMKITEGTGYVDPKWRDNYAGFAGLPRGAYHFCGSSVRKTYLDPEDEANHFADVYLQRRWEMRPVYDVELAGASPNWLRAFRARFRRRAGVTADRVYTSHWLITGALAPRRWLGDLDTDLWIARYNRVLGFDHERLVLWQYTSSGRIAGLPGRVDLNREMNDWHPSHDAHGDVPGSDLAALYGGTNMLTLPAGGGEDHSRIEPVPVPSLLRAHDLVVAPSHKRAVVLRSINTWKNQATPLPGANVRNPGGFGDLLDGKEFVVWEHSGKSFVVPRGTAKIDIAYWSAEPFRLTLSPR